MHHAETTTTTTTTTTTAAEPVQVLREERWRSVAHGEEFRGSYLVDGRYEVEIYRCDTGGPTQNCTCGPYRRRQSTTDPVCDHIWRAVVRVCGLTGHSLSSEAVFLLDPR